MTDNRPSNCRNVLRDQGKLYPKSGCDYCKNGGLMGCPFEKEKTKLEKNLLDHYHIHGNDYDIYEINSGNFEIWKTDKQGKTYQIHITPEVNSLTDVRKHLYIFAQSQLNAEYHGLQQLVQNARMALDKLEGSPYNLEKFRRLI